jgi:hypothetical protein
LSPPDSIRISRGRETRAQLGDRGEVDRGVLADRGVRAAAGLDAGDALGGSAPERVRNSASSLV